MVSCGEGFELIVTYNEKGITRLGLVFHENTPSASLISTIAYVETLDYCH
jgi:hypothetical protein